MTTQELQQLQLAFDKNHVSRKEFYIPISEGGINELQFLLVGLAGEVGELANIIKKMARGDCAEEESRAQLIEECADVFIYLLKFSGQLNFDLETAFLKKLEINRERFRDFEK